MRGKISRYPSESNGIIQGLKKYEGHSTAYSARSLIQPTNSNCETFVFITAVQ